MRSILIVFSILMLVSCSATKEKNQIKSIYISQFRLNYFKSCLKNGFNNSDEIKKILELDFSGYGEPILEESNFFFDSITKINTIKKIKTDSIISIGNKQEGAQGEKVFSLCLCAYNSKWLDSLSKIKYKKHLKSDRNFRRALNK